MYLKFQIHPLSFKMKKYLIIGLMHDLKLCATNLTNIKITALINSHGWRLLFQDPK